VGQNPARSTNRNVCKEERHSCREPTCSSGLNFADMPPHGSELDAGGSSSRSTHASPPGASPADLLEATSSGGGQGAPAPGRSLVRQASARTALAAPPNAEECRLEEVAIDVHNSGPEDQRRTSLEGSRPILRTSIDRPREVEMRKLPKPRRSVSFHEEDDVKVMQPPSPASPFPLDTDGDTTTTRNVWTLWRFAGDP
jgi:hypothetical protein